MTTEIDLGKPGDFHVHLRDGKMLELIAPTVEQGGISIAYIMVCSEMVSSNVRFDYKY